MRPDEVDALPLAQYLTLEVLAGRYRAGDGVWTFPSRVRPALRDLEKYGLVWWKEGVVEKTVLAGLTSAGKSAVLIAGYLPLGAKTENKSSHDEEHFIDTGECACERSCCWIQRTCQCICPGCTCESHDHSARSETT